MFKQVRAPKAHVKQRAYPKQVAQDCDVERYGNFKLKNDKNIFAAYDKAEMRKAEILVIASSKFLNTSKSFFWPDRVILTGTDLNSMQYK